MSKPYVSYIKYGSYSTIFSAEGDIDLKLASRACFAEILNRGEYIQNEIYTLILVRDPEYAIKHRFYHLCYLSESELKKHIGLARRLFPFTYSVEKCNYQNYNAFEVKLELHAEMFYHRYLLSWVRYTYEFPFNVILNDAIRMKHMYIRNESYTNLFVLCANCYSDGITSFNSGHSIAYQKSMFLKERTLRNKINSMAALKQRNTKVNDIYRINPALRARHDRKEGSNYFEYWNDPEEFEIRAKEYLQYYPKYKSNESVRSRRSN